MNNPRLQPYNEYEETEYEQADQYEQVCVFPTKSKSKSKQVWVWANQYEQVCVFPTKCMSKFQTNPNPSKYEYEPTNMSRCVGYPTRCEARPPDAIKGNIWKHKVRFYEDGPPDNSLGT